MKINVIKIDREEYIKVKIKADKWDNYIKGCRAGAAKTNNLSKAELSERNRRAAKVRWIKEKA